MTRQEAQHHADQGTVLRDHTGTRWVVASCSHACVVLEQPGLGRLLSVPLSFCILTPED